MTYLRQRFGLPLLMPHARSTHQPRSASNRANSPEISSSRPNRADKGKHTSAAASKMTETSPRAIRPLVCRLGTRIFFIAGNLLFMPDE